LVSEIRIDRVGDALAACKAAGIDDDAVSKPSSLLSFAMAIYSQNLTITQEDLRASLARHNATVRRSSASPAN
jgi:hypothetical protein